MWTSIRGCVTTILPMGDQWRNRRGGGQGGRVPPRDFWPGNFFLTYREKRGKENREKGVKIENKRRKIVKGKVENWKWKWEKLLTELKEFFAFFFFFFFFFFAFHFWKRRKWRKYVLGLPKWEFSTGKKNISRREKWLCPLRKKCLLRPCGEYVCRQHRLQVDL